MDLWTPLYRSIFHCACFCLGIHSIQLPASEEKEVAIHDRGWHGGAMEAPSQKSLTPPKSNKPYVAIYKYNSKWCFNSLVMLYLIDIFSHCPLILRKILSISPMGQSMPSHLETTIVLSDTSHTHTYDHAYSECHAISYICAYSYNLTSCDNGHHNSFCSQYSIYSCFILLLL